MYQRRRGAAPYDLIARDFRELDAAEDLRTTWDVERLILIQSVQGHAHEGHGMFSGTQHPNTTIDDISRALRLDPIWVRSERQRLIDEMEEYVDRVIGGEESPPLTNTQGVGLLGSSIFENLRLSGRDVLRGIYIGGLRDDVDVRAEMEARYGTTIGGGRCYLVDTRVMDELGLDGDILAHGSHAHVIDDYRDQGLIVGEEGEDKGDLEYMYIRHRRGLGASDDTAITAAGLIYGLGEAVGVFLSDAIDTLEKYVPFYSDQDERLALKIGERYPDLGISRKEVLHITYLSAIPEEASIDVPDCSLRHMMVIDKKVNMTTIESHFLCSQRKPYPPVRIGHEKILNKRFYNYVEERLLLSPGLGG